MKRYVTLTIRQHRAEVKKVANLILAGNSIRETANIVNLPFGRIVKDIHEYIKPYFGEEFYLKVKQELNNHRKNRPRMLPRLEDINNEENSHIDGDCAEENYE